MDEVVVSLPGELVALIYEAARREGRTRDEVLREAIERYLREGGRVRRWEDPVVLNAIATQDRIARHDRAEGWDPVEEIRRMRESRR